MTPQEKQIYARHLSLKSVGVDGQNKILKTSIKNMSNRSFMPALLHTCTRAGMRVDAKNAAHPNKEETSIENTIFISDSIELIDTYFTNSQEQLSTSYAAWVQNSYIVLIPNSAIDLFRNCHERPKCKEPRLQKTGAYTPVCEDFLDTVTPQFGRAVSFERGLIFANIWPLSQIKNTRLELTLSAACLGVLLASELMLWLVLDKRIAQTIHFKSPFEESLCGNEM